MAAPGRPPRQRGSGGRTLMLLGVLLALAAGTIVIYIVSQATSTGPQLQTVVVAKIELPANTILSSTTTDAQHTLISAAFQEVQMPVTSTPTDAFKFTDETQLEATFNNFVVVGEFLQGDILRTADKRLAAAGTGGPGSLTNISPAQLPQNYILMEMTLTGGSGSASKPIAVAGDYVDFLATECSLPNATSSGCETQTTLQSVYVYYTTPSQIIVALSHQDALKLLELQQTASHIEVVVRRTDDKGAAANTQEVDPGSIAKAFNY
jgi:hypothetical protein